MKTRFTIILLSALLLFSCGEKSISTGRVPILEVEGRILYEDELNEIIPANISVIDSTQMAERYIKNWVTQTLMFENAKRNITNVKEIDKLVEEYRQALIIHEYEQAIISERIDRKVTETEVKEFYEKFKESQRLTDNLIKGILLILPNDAPQLDDVREWVRKADRDALEKIEKYSLQNAISYDYFLDKWANFTEINKKAPFEYNDSRSFLSSNRFAEQTDSAKHYMLRITEVAFSGDVEPYENAKERIATIIFNKKKADFIVNFEKNVYEDAIKNGNVNFIYKKQNN